MGECTVNGKKIELMADVPTLPQVDDPAAPSPVMEFVPPEQTCEKYRRFLEAVDAFIREKLLGFGIPNVELYRAEQHLPGQTWSFYYKGLREDHVPVSLSGVEEMDVPEGAVLTMDKFGVVYISPKGATGPAGRLQ